MEIVCTTCLKINFQEVSLSFPPPKKIEEENEIKIYSKILLNELKNTPLFFHYEYVYEQYISNNIFIFKLITNVDRARWLEEHAMKDGMSKGMYSNKRISRRDEDSHDVRVVFARLITRKAIGRFINYA